MVKFHKKGDNKRYATRGEVYKMMGSVIEANKNQIERNSKKRRYALVREVPNSTPLHVGSSETESYNIPMAVTKRRKESKTKKVISKTGHKSMKKSPLKNESVSKNITMKLVCQGTRSSC